MLPRLRRRTNTDDQSRGETVEYDRRVAALQAAVREAGLDLFVVSAFDSLYYLTGAGFEPLERPFFLLVRPDRPPELLVPRLDQDHMRAAARSAVAAVHDYPEFPAAAGHGWAERLGHLAASARMVGCEPSLRLDLAGQFPVRPQVHPLVERLRRVKSPVEVEMIRRAARYADEGVRQLMAASYRGASVAEGFARTGTVMARIIREVPAWEPLTTRVLMATWAAPRSGRPHSIPNLADLLNCGPHVGLVLTRVNGYSAESERTYFTAPPTADMRAAFAAMLQARTLALGMVRPGVPTADIDAAVNDLLDREYPDCRLHRTGHGIGLSAHEGPWLAVGADDVLAPNMVVSVEPGIYLPGHGGYRHSDTVLVTPGGGEVLTRLPTDIESLTVRGLRLWARARGWCVRRALGIGPAPADHETVAGGDDSGLRSPGSAPPLPGHGGERDDPAVCDRADDGDPQHGVAPAGHDGR